MKDNKTYTCGGLGDFFIISAKQKMKGIDLSEVDLLHTDQGQITHKDNIEYLAKYFFHYNSLTWSNEREQKELIDYVTKAEDGYDNYDAVRNLFGTLDHHEEYIVIQSEAGTNSFSAHHTRTWNGIEINQLIDVFSKRIKIFVVGNNVGQISSKNCTYIINGNIMDAMNIVYNAKLFIGFDGFLSYIRSYTGKNQLVRLNKNYDVYYSKEQKEFTLPFLETRDLLHLMKGIT